MCAGLGRCTGKLDTAKRDATTCLVGTMMYKGVDGMKHKASVPE